MTTTPNCGTGSGWCPQENILHTQLSARRALRYAAELRFPRDTSPAEREHRIGEVLGELSLTARRYPRVVAFRRPAKAR
jgi:ABC-type multidrug transport system ATPase subunit